MSRLRERLEKIKVVLDSYDPTVPGKPLAVTVEDINFLAGACDSLLAQYAKLQSAYQNDFKSLHEKIENQDKEYKNLRKITDRLSERCTKYKQVIRQVYTIPKFFRRRLKAELESMETMENSWRD